MYKFIIVGGNNVEVFYISKQKVYAAVKQFAKWYDLDNENIYVYILVDEIENHPVNINTLNTILYRTYYVSDGSVEKIFN